MRDFPSYRPKKPSQIMRDFGAFGKKKPSQIMNVILHQQSLLFQ